jgi:serine/threonine-protein kinase
MDQSLIERLRNALASQYEVERELGAGGMATVYLAQDLKHERQVAIKVLRPELAAVLGADRFVQEIKTTANLHHPHILPLFDSGEADGFLYYVMPYIEGETLRDKLNRETQLGIDEAVRITTEVADALDYAHRRNVIHRDIKPENVLLHDGRPMVADFGIALAVSAAAGGRMTETGLSLGTPHYMSPEQATAEKDITPRSDIYSLGSVLYEMLTGDPPHTGSSAQQIIMKIVTDEARPLTELRKSVPANVAAATAKSLEKLPADRFESARGFAEALRDSTFTTPTTGVMSGIARPHDRWNRLSVAVAAFAVLATAAGVWGWLRPAARNADRSVVEFYLEPPDPNASFVSDIVLSPDGRRLVAQVDTDEGSVLYQRMLDSRDWRIIPGTQGAYAPFFSPDGVWLAFASDPEESIMRVPVVGGTPQTIVQIETGMLGASWGPDNTVVFSGFQGTAGQSPALFRVTADGGVPERLTTPDASEQAHLSPYYLPSGEVILFTTIATGQPFIAALSLESMTVSRLTPGMTPSSDRSGRVVYVTSDGLAMAQTFNARAMVLEGSRRRIAEGIAVMFGAAASYTLSSDGSLVYLSGTGREDELVLVSREGATQSLFPGSGVGSGVAHPRFSPSGDRIAFIKTDGVDLGDVWVYSLVDETAQRLSFEGPTADPAWTSDGRSIGYSVRGEEDGSSANLYLRAADGTGSAEQIVVVDDDLWQMDFAPGGGEVVFRSVNDLFRSTLGSDSRPVPLLETEAFEEHPTLSPDGRWIAYKSNETGIDEVYVRSYPNMGPRTVVSIGGGTAPAWSDDGSEIFYWGRGHIMAASVRHDGSRLTVVERTELFRAGSFRQQANRNYDVHPNGREFVMVGGQTTRAVVRVNALAGEQ